jgi:hypothetical protein
MLSALPLYFFGFLGLKIPFLYDINTIYNTSIGTNMAFFGLSDISFNKGTGATRGPLAELSGSEFEQTTLRYPLDIGNYDKSHYVVLYIRQQNSTSFKRPPADMGNFDSDNYNTMDVKSGGNQISNLANQVGGEIVSKANSALGKFNEVTNNKLAGLTGALSKGITNIVGGAQNIFASTPNVNLGGGSSDTTAIIDNSIKRISKKSSVAGFDRPTYLTTDAIALYMPDTLAYTYSQSYETPSMGNEIGGQALAAGKSAIDAYNKGGAESAGDSLKKSGLENIKEILAKGAGKITASENTAKLFLASTGRIVNPMLEMLYQSPNFRTFNFEFLFYPRDEREALEVQSILERLRFHQAPEILKEGGVAGGFLVPPSEFDIRFYYSGSENPNIPQIATCVLLTMDVNYAPNGWSAYEVPDEFKPSIGRTGMPTAIQLTLSFQETTYLTKDDFSENLVNANSLGARS